MNELETYFKLEAQPRRGASRVFNATRVSDGRRVVIKRLAAEYPTAEELAGLRHEFSVLRRLEQAGAPVAFAVELVRDGRRQALVLEPASGRVMSRTSAEGLPSPERFLRMAIATSRCLAAVHEAGVVHRDVKPQHFFVDEASGKATLIDFGLATELTQERTYPAAVDRIEGTFAYMSPEQTGRMNRVVDRRSDIYSLGVTLYELVAGQRPFAGEDPLELIHAHLARVPVPLSKLRPELPTVLSDIVMRLLEKMPEARYQTASGLQKDLERALRSLASQGTVEPFELGREDHHERLQIPEELYGRDRQRRALTAAFERVKSGATELYLLSGAAGTGKSALVNEVHRELVRGGYFVSGKFDQYDRGVPYSALAAACGEVVRVHLAASAAALADWKRRITAALGENLRVVADVVPEVVLAFGSQPAVASLSPSEAQIRFERSFQRFVQASATGDSPLVLFLDDLQWADLASLSVLRQVLSASDQHHLLVIGAYRDDEVDPAHPLSLCLGSLAEALPIHRAETGPLGLEDVERLISHALRFRSEPIEPLARLTYDKTSGNPFFVIQFLQRLEADGLISFNRERGFSWDLEVVASREATGNVVDLVVSRLARLDPCASELLPLAACIGHTFRLSTLIVVADKAPREVVAGLQAAANDGLILPLDRNHRILEDLVETADGRVEASYRFAHDRVQQAAYVTIPEARRSLAHLRIGRLLLRDAGVEGPRDAELFDVVSQLNRGREHLVGDERLALSRLNLRAAERAHTAAAHQAALEFATLSLELLGDEPWRADYPTALAAHEVAVTSQCLQGNEERAVAFIEEVERNAKTAFERTRVRNLKTDLLTNQGRFREAIHVSMETLALLGAPLPDPDDKAALGASIGAAFGAYQAALGERQVGSLLELQPMTDPQRVAELATMAGAIPAAFQSNPELNVLLVLRAVQLSLDHGNGPTSPFFYTLYGIVHYVVTNDYARGFQFGELGLELSRRPEHAAVRCRAHFILATHLSPWVRPLQESFEHHERGVVLGWDGGDLIHAGYCMGFSVLYRMYAGEGLSDISRRIPAYRARLSATGNVINLTFLSVVERLIATLTRKTERFGCFDGADFSEAAFEQNASLTARATYGAAKAMARYLAGDAEEALRAAEEFHPLPGLYYNAEYVFYHGMACAELAAKAAGARRVELLEKLDQDLQKFALWSGLCAENFGARYELLRAEAHAVRDETGAALDAFERAIELGSAASAVHHLALACERAGRFHQRLGRLRWAKSCLEDACYHYGQWGAAAKVAQLQAEFPSIVRALTHEAGASVTRVIGDSSTASGSLDFTSAMRATQALASELQLGPLVRRLMKVLMENAGATHGCLVLPRRDVLELSASLTLEPETVQLDLHEPLEETARVPASIVQYCARSRQTVVLNDAGADPRFAQDPRVIERENRSIVCVPLVHQGRLAGLLYLENAASTGIFHAGRIERLEFLAGHAAVALHNARLYEELQEANQTLELRVKQRTAELSTRNAAMRRVLDSVSQGLLAVDLDGRLTSERSAVVDEWFGGFEVGTTIHEYLGRIDAEFARVFKVMSSMFVDALLPEALILSQLPSALTYAGRHYRINYEPIRTNDELAGLLLVVDDVTEALKGAREDAEQKEQLAVSRWLARDRAHLLGFFDEGRALIERIVPAGARDLDACAALHTLKGSAGMFEFELLSSLCHRAENALDNEVGAPEATQAVKDHWASLEKSLELLMGSEGRNRIEISRPTLETLLERLKSGAGVDHAIAALERFGLAPLARPLEHLGERALDLCKRLGRAEPVIRIDDGGLLGDPRAGSKLWAALTHLVRNAVDHGLDSPDARCAAGKSPRATLRLAASLDGTAAVIEIADDGHGVAWDLVRERARRRALPSASHADLVEALFASSFSTRDEVTTTSGRGMGLAAVRAEVAALGGHLDLESEVNQGCRIVVRLPAAALGIRRANAAPSTNAPSPPLDRAV